MTGLVDKTGQTLVQGVEPALNMAGLPDAVQDMLVSFPEIAERPAAYVSDGNPPPQL
jgi:hypothetical protein